MIASIAFVSLLFAGGASPSSTLSDPEAAVTCRESPTEDLLPWVVAPMTGARPAWFVDGGANFTGRPVKTLWVMARTSAPVRITGRRVDGPGTVQFSRDQNEPLDALVIADPGAASVIPGGAPPEVMRAYSFIPSHAIYSSPGCWEFTVQVGTDQVRIVRELKPAQ